MSSLLNDGFGRLLFYRESHLFSIYLELLFPTILAGWSAERRLLRDEAGQLRPRRSLATRRLNARPVERVRSERKSAGSRILQANIFKKITLVNFDHLLLFFEKRTFFHQRYELYNPFLMRTTAGLFCPL